MKQIKNIIILLCAVMNTYPVAAQLRSLSTREIIQDREIKTTTTVTSSTIERYNFLTPGQFTEKTPMTAAPLNSNNMVYYYPKTIDLISEASDARYYFSDVNGDGNDELLSIGGLVKNTIILGRKADNSIGRSGTFRLPEEFRPHNKLFLGRFNETGGRNVIIYYPDTYYFFAYQFNATSAWVLERPYHILTNWTYQHDIYTGDFNGDGFTDLLFWEKGANQWHVSLYEPRKITSGTGAMAPGGVWLKGWAQSADMKCVTGDFNGDRKDDIALVHQPTGEWWVALSNGSSFQPSQGYKYNVWLKPWSIGTHQQFTGMDVNNDGLCDIVSYDPKERSFQAVLSNGQYFDYFMKKEFIDPAIQNPLQVVAGKFAGNPLITIIHEVSDRTASVPRNMASIYYTHYRR